MSSELDYEEAPEMDVPMARDWIGPAFEAWTRGCYPRRRGTFFVWGWLLPIWGAWLLFKFMIYFGGVLLILFGGGWLMIADLATYHHRRKRALRGSL